MKARLIINVLGIAVSDREIEIGENSILGALARGDWKTAMKGVHSFQQDLDELGVGRVKIDAEAGLRMPDGAEARRMRRKERVT